MGAKLEAGDKSPAFALLNQNEEKAEKKLKEKAKEEKKEGKKEDKKEGAKGDDFVIPELAGP